MSNKSRGRVRCDGCGYTLNESHAFTWGKNLLCEDCYLEATSGQQLSVVEHHPADQPSDLDQHNPVDCSADTWRELYARNPDLLDYDQEP